MNIDFNFRVFHEIKFDLDEILYSGAFEVADYESEFKIQTFNMANPNGRPKCKKLLELKEILYSEVFEVYPGRFNPPPPPPHAPPPPVYPRHFTPHMGSTFSFSIFRIVFWGEIYRELPCFRNHQMIISGSRSKVEKTMKNSVFSTFVCDSEIVME